MDDRFAFAHPNLILKELNTLARENNFHFNSVPGELYPHNEWNSVQCSMSLEEYDDAAFMLQQMPGCCAMLTISYVRVHPNSQEQFDKVLQRIEQAAYRAGFGLVTLTQVVPMYSRMFWKHEPWFRCLDRGWQASEPFRNAKSGNLCVVITKDLKQLAKREGLEHRVQLAVPAK